MILFGYYLDRFGIPLFSVHLLITFLVIGEIALLKKPHLLRSTIKADKKFTLGFVFLYLLQDFLCIFSQHYRRFFPVGRNCDMFQHFAIPKYIAERNSLLFGDTPHICCISRLK